MTKRWIYGLMLFAAVGMIVVAGSLAVTEQRGAPTGAIEDGAGLAGISTAGAVGYTNTVGPYFQWYAVTFPTDSGFVLVYTVPSNARFKIDEIIMSNAATTGISSNYVWRGPSGGSLSMVKWLKPNDGFQQSFNGFILAGGEQLKIKTLNSATTSSGTTWMITGHLI